MGTTTTPCGRCYAARDSCYLNARAKTAPHLRPPDKSTQNSRPCGLQHVCVRKTLKYWHAIHYYTPHACGCYITSACFSFVGAGRSCVYAPRVREAYQSSGSNTAAHAHEVELRSRGGVAATANDHRHRHRQVSSRSLVWSRLVSARSLLFIYVKMVNANWSERVTATTATATAAAVVVKKPPKTTLGAAAVII